MSMLSIIIAALQLVVTGVLTGLAYNLTKKVHESTSLSISKDLVNEFDKAMINSEENLSEITKLRTPPPGFNKRQEHLMFIYLNHLEYTSRAKEAGLISEEIRDAYIKDCLSYYRNNLEALKHQLKHGYTDDFAKLLNEHYEKEFGKKLASDSNQHPTLEGP